VTDSTPIRVAGSADKARIAVMLARAFADDPAMTYIFPDPAIRAHKMPRLLGLLFDEDAGGMRLVTAGGEAATLWRGPGQTRTTYWHMLRQALPMIGTFGAALGRAMAVSNAIDVHFPRGDYWYLHIAGCDPAAQGRGLGGVGRAGARRGLRPAGLSGNGDRAQSGLLSRDRIRDTRRLARGEGRAAVLVDVAGRGQGLTSSPAKAGAQLGTLWKRPQRDLISAFPTGPRPPPGSSIG
jgi:hypothetical protein